MAASGLGAGEEAFDLGRGQVQEPERGHVLAVGADDEGQGIERGPAVRQGDSQADGGAGGQRSVQAGAEAVGADLDHRAGRHTALVGDDPQRQRHGEAGGESPLASP